MQDAVDSMNAVIKEWREAATVCDQSTDSHCAEDFEAARIYRKCADDLAASLSRDPLPDEVTVTAQPATEADKQEWARLAADPQTIWQPSVVLFAFMGWLTSRDERTVLSATDDAAPAADLVKQFCDHYGFAEPREGWHHMIKSLPASPLPTGETQ